MAEYQCYGCKGKGKIECTDTKGKKFTVTCTACGGTGKINFSSPKEAKNKVVK